MYINEIFILWSKVSIDNATRREIFGTFVIFKYTLQ